MKAQNEGFHLKNNHHHLCCFYIKLYIKKKSFITILNDLTCMQHAHTAQDQA